MRPVTPSSVHVVKKSVTVPEPTEDRLQRAAEASVDDSAVSEPGMYAETKQLSKQELAKLAKQRAVASMATSGGRRCSPEKIGASRFRRLLAVVVDGIIDLVMCVLAGVLVATLFFAKVLDLSTIKIDPLLLSQDPYSVLLTLPWQLLAAGAFVPVVVTPIQWQLISTRGQSIGKILLSIKIVDKAGNPPGFAQGVVMRNGLRTVWNYIPTYAAAFVAAGLLPYISAAVAIGAMANILFICLSPPRCLHDHIAGTYVIDA